MSATSSDRTSASSADAGTEAGAEAVPATSGAEAGAEAVPATSGAEAGADAEAVPATSTDRTSASDAGGALAERPLAARRVLHLVRDTPPAGAVAAGDWVVYLEPTRLAPTGAPPLPAGSIDHDQLVQLSFAADLVVTW